MKDVIHHLKKKNGYTAHTVDVYSLEDDVTPAVKNVIKKA